MAEKIDEKAVEKQSAYLRGFLKSDFARRHFAEEEELTKRLIKADLDHVNAARFFLCEGDPKKYKARSKADEEKAIRVMAVARCKLVDAHRKYADCVDLKD